MKTKLWGKKEISVIARAIIAGVLVLSALGISVFAWIGATEGIMSYAPISSPDAVHIGAGHRDIANDTFEDIRYMYFTGLDVEDDYMYRVFCVYGKGSEGEANYKLQIAYTTNNQFVYNIFRATEYTLSQLLAANLATENVVDEITTYTFEAGVVAYETHEETPRTFYYYFNAVELGNPVAVAGTYLNTQVVAGETIANGTKHSATYGGYGNVNKYAEPVYWQTGQIKTLIAEGDDFVDYYILRVDTNGKTENDRETDVLCLAAKTS